MTHCVISKMAPRKANTNIKVPKKIDKVKKTISKEDKKQKKGKESYATYIDMVLKQVHPDIKVSSKDKSIMNSFFNNVFERINSESSRLTHYKNNKKRSLTSREIQNAIKVLLMLLLPDDSSK